MIRKFREEDTVKVMTIWTKGNFEAHSFIDKDYWLLNFNKVKDEYLKRAETYVYVEDDIIKGFISLLNNNFIGALFIRKEYRRQGIGRKLINFVKDKYDKLELQVYEKNVNAMLFYASLGFVNKKIQIDDNTNEKEYVMEWDKKREEAKIELASSLVI